MRRPGFWVQVYQSLEIRIKHLRYLRGTTLSCWWPAYAPKRRSHVGVAHPPIPVSKPEPLRRNCASDVCPKVDLAPPSRAQNRPTPAGLRRHRRHKRHKRHSFQWNIASKTRDWSYSGIYIYRYSDEPSCQQLSLKIPRTSNLDGNATPTSKLWNVLSFWGRKWQNFACGGWVIAQSPPSPPVQEIRNWSSDTALTMRGSSTLQPCARRPYLADHPSSSCHTAWSSSTSRVRCTHTYMTYIYTVHIYI